MGNPLTSAHICLLALTRTHEADDSPLPASLFAPRLATAGSAASSAPTSGHERGKDLFSPRAKPDFINVSPLSSIPAFFLCASEIRVRRSPAVVSPQSQCLHILIVALAVLFCTLQALNEGLSDDDDEEFSAALRRR